jgi:hypothetical protein
MRRSGVAVLANVALGLCAGQPAAGDPAWAAGQALPRLVSYRVGEHPRYDRVVWVLSGGLPGHSVRYVPRVTEDASGTPVRLLGRAFLEVTLKDVNWTDHVPAEPTLTPQFRVLRQMKPAGVFEAFFTFGLGLSHRTSFHLWTARHPDRVILDLLG